MRWFQSGGFPVDEGDAKVETLSLEPTLTYQGITAFSKSHTHLVFRSI